MTIGVETTLRQGRVLLEKWGFGRAGAVMAGGVCSFLTSLLLRRLGLEGGSLWGAVLRSLLAAAGAGALTVWNGQETGTGQPKSRSAAQVQLEQTAQLLSRLQRSLLETPPTVIDREALADCVRRNACEPCSKRGCCPQCGEITPALLEDDGGFRCEKTVRVLRELRTARLQQQLLKLSHNRQGEYRTALVQQYGFLSGLMARLSDRLSGETEEAEPVYRIQVSARSCKKEEVNGDLCMAFAGEGSRFYVLLCDGMGTGAGAARQARQTAETVRGLLSAGMPPQYALGCINSLLILQELSGAVTIDLAEIRLDSGQTAVYKWGAPSSLFFRHGKPLRVGRQTLPPGLSLTEERESAAHISMEQGEFLVLMTDGVRLDGARLRTIGRLEEPTAMAEQLIAQAAAPDDDATVAVIRLLPLRA